MKYKINKHINSTLKNSYAKESDTGIYPINIDCYEGINNITFPKYALEILNNIETDIIKNYPHETQIKDSIKKYWNEGDFENLETDNIILCDGSISGIYIINRLFLETGDKVLGYVPQFPEYAMDVKMHGCEYNYYKLNSKNRYKFVDCEFIDYINKDYKLIYIDNPNNPTGQIIPLSSIEKILIKAKELGIMVIVDEAYGEYMHKDNSSINLMSKYKNLIVIKTFSKGFALAGLRAGYLTIPKELKEAFGKITNPYSVNGIARKISSLVLEEYDFIKETQDKNAQIKDNFIKEWKNIKISETNQSVSIFLIEHNNKNINLKEEFAKLGISVVCGSSFESLNKNFARLRIPPYEYIEDIVSAFEHIDNL